MIGQTISHYRILEKLGEGGMGVVFKAHDSRLDRAVALKFLAPSLIAQKTEQARFLQEARAAAVLNHPNVCVIHDIIEHDEGPCIVMEYVEGETLRHYFAVAPMTVHETVGYVLQIADALNDAHSRGIVHRDIKSDNIMITTKNQVKIMDFGLAKLKGSVKLTKAEGATGTPAYMAPEQIQGADVDGRADIFSLGVVMFEMLTGHTPFRGEHEAAIMYSIVNEDPQPIDRYRQDVPVEIQHVIQRALEKKPDHRYPTAADMIIDLRRDTRETQRITKPSLPLIPPVVPQRKRNSQKILLWIAAAMLIGMGVWISVKRLIQTDPLSATFEQITDQLGVEYFPNYSPDGNFVVYSRYAHGSVDIFLQRIGGDPINLTPESPEFDYAPAFSPDGQWIAFRSERQGGGIYIMGSTGESVRRVSDFGYNPAWTPDGGHIIVATEAVVNPVGRISKSELWSIDVATGNKTIIYEGDAVQPAVSPNQHRIAFWGLPDGTGVRDIFTIPVAGGEAVAVTSDAFVDWNPTWSADGRFLYFASDRGGTMNIWRVTIDERTGKTASEPEPLTAPASWTGHLHVSHDDTRIVYVAQNEISTVQRVRWDPLTSLLEETPQVVLQKNAFYIDCSPDGESLVLSTSGAQEDLFVIRADGTERRQLTNDIHKDRGPSWASDGSKIYFYSNRTGRYEIWSIAPDGSDLRQVTALTDVTVFEPHVLPNHRGLIVNTSDRGACFVDLTTGTPSKPVPLIRKDSLAGNFRVASIRSDGQKLCGNFQRADGEIIEGIVMYDVLTQRCERVTNFGIAHSWLRGQDQLLYIASDKIFLLDAATQKIRFVMKPPANGFITSLTLSPENDILYYVTTTIDSDIWQATIGK